jgi:hypothetical protein
VRATTCGNEVDQKHRHRPLCSLAGIRWLSPGLTWLVACGGGNHALTDAAAGSTVDAATDAAPDAAPDAALDAAADAAPDAGAATITIHAFGRDVPGTGPRSPCI